MVIKGKSIGQVGILCVSPSVWVDWASKISKILMTLYWLSKFGVFWATKVLFSIDSSKLSSSRVGVFSMQRLGLVLLPGKASSKGVM